MPLIRVELFDYRMSDETSAAPLPSNSLWSCLS